jgi:hypothetical protein
MQKCSACAPQQTGVVNRSSCTCPLVMVSEVIARSEQYVLMQLQGLGVSMYCIVLSSSTGLPSVVCLVYRQSGVPLATCAFSTLSIIHIL